MIKGKLSVVRLEEEASGVDEGGGEVGLLREPFRNSKRLREDLVCLELLPLGSV